MGLDGPTSCFPSLHHHHHHHQQQQQQQLGGVGVDPFEEAVSAAANSAKMPGSGGMAGGHQQLMLPEMAPADDFPDDLNGIPLANLTNTSLDGKVEPYFGFAPPSVSSSTAHHNGGAGVGATSGGFPSNTPSTSSDSAGTVVVEQHQQQQQYQNGGVRSSSRHRLVIRDPFDDDLPTTTTTIDNNSNEDEQYNQQQMLDGGCGTFGMPSSSSSWFSAAAMPSSTQQCRPPPMLDGRTWMDQVRANGGGDQRPLVPAPGNGAPTSMLPQYAFHMTPMQRQRLEAMYPPGTFSSTYFRIHPMPPPRGFMPAQMPRFVMMQVRPNLLPPQLAAGVKVGPGQTPCLPVPLICGFGGLPYVLLPNNALVPIHPQMLVGAGPPMMPPPGGAPGAMPLPMQTPHQQAGPSNGKHQQQNSGGSAASSTTGGSGATTGAGTTKEGKPRKETAKARRAREKAEAAEQQRQHDAAAAMAAAAAAAAAGMGMPPPQGQPLVGVRSPCDGVPVGSFTATTAQPQPSSAMMMGGGGPHGIPPYGTMPGCNGNLMQQQQQQHQQMMCHQQQQMNAAAACLNPPHTPQQQDAIFKVPGRSPSSLKRASLPPPPMFAPATLMPMPDQRIQLSGHCQVCRNELSDQHKGIQCTAISQGCNRVFHWECAELTPEAFQEFCKDPRLEWICRDCYAQKGANCVFAI